MRRILIERVIPVVYRFTRKEMRRCALLARNERRLSDLHFAIFYRNFSILIEQFIQASVMADLEKHS
jgi:hypothetical protein